LSCVQFLFVLSKKKKFYFFKLICYLYEQ